ncbi:MAG: Microtubule-associated protein, microtubule dynamics during spindle orientation [Chrysothrix sp. TS-e1954]|nr:MAG: Microtubule-associated protein, microtubule dynamics during spindle orientation [Chrysothrix sp. TS-e1954]
MADAEEDYSSLSLTERFTHKNWKVRKEAYEAAGKEFDNAQTESDPVVRQFVQDSSLWKGAVADSNVAAHQEALTALCSFLQIAGTQGCTRTRGATIGPLAEKGLISTKAVAKQKSMEAILLYVELDKPDPIIDELLPLLSHKLPKIVAATLSAFTAIYHAYGCKTVEPKPVLKTLPKVYGHADKNVRAEAQNLTVELYRWLRESMKPLFWNELKPVQQTDLDKLFEKVKDEPSPKPERLLKSQQAKVEAAKAQAVPEDAEEDAEEEGAEADEEPMMMAVDVFPKIPKDLQERLSSSKWKDRKDGLDDLHTAINAPAIEDGPFHEIMAALAKCMKDANIAVVTVAAQCIELLAKGLGKKFSKYRSTVLNPIMERLKERKQSVTDALAAALDAVCQSTSLSDCLEEALGHLTNKNPQIKLESSRFLVRGLKTTRDAPSIPETKLIADAASKLLTDSQDTQRNAGAEILGTLWKIMGDRVMNVHFEGLDDIRKAKIKESMESAEVKAKYKPKAAPPPKAAPAAAPFKKPAAKKAPTSSAAKKAAPPPRPAPVDSPSPPPQKLQPKPTARPGGVPRPGTITSAPKGLRPPSGIKAPGSRPPPGPYSQASASPSRPSQISPPVSPPQAAPKPLSRGLTGRTLAKPSDSNPQPPASPRSTSQTPLPSIERIELDELRAESARLRQSNESLRSDHLRLSDQIHELQNQNAQLIEDHTRDVLSIKAKETQLVRARSDAETAEQSVSQLTREVERLKRELGRMGRATSPRASDISAGDIFASSLDANAARGDGIMSPTERFRHGQGQSPFPPPSSSTNTSSRPTASTTSPARQNTSSTTPRPPSTSSTTNSTRQRQELADSDGNPKAPPPGARNTSASADSDGRSSGGSNGGLVSERAGKPVTKPVGGGARTNGAGGSGEGVESWKRAAEVTQNLKARIELMKQRQQGMQR